MTIHVRSLRVLIALLSLWLCVIVARSVPDAHRFSHDARNFAYDLVDSSLEPRNASQLVARDGEDDSPDGIECRTLCSASSGQATRRSIYSLDTRAPLMKRVFDPFPPLDNTNNGRDQFMIQACDGLSGDEEVVPSWASDDPGWASIATKEIGDTAFRMGMQEICGCTMLYVVSRKRVYLGHYWEDRSFGKPKGSTEPLQFNEQVINFLANGFAAPGQAQQDSLAQHAADFTGDGLTVIIMTPDRSVKNPEGNPFYPAKIRDMKAAVAAALNIDGERVTVNTYAPVDKKKDTTNALKTTAAGHMIFDFDPKGGSRATPYAWRIIWQRNILAGDEWKP